MKKKTICSLCQSKNNFDLKYRLSNFNIIRCKKCSLLTRDVIFESNEVRQLYDKSYFCNLQKKYFSAGISQSLEKSVRVKDFKERWKTILKKTQLKHGVVLDIGAATGVFLSCVKNTNWRVNGVEISKDAVKLARTRMKINIFEGELKDAKFENGHFDIVTAWDVIEHSEDPGTLIREIHHVLKPNGYLVIQTTMVDSILFLIADLSYKLTFGKFTKLVEVAYPIHHANHFSRKTLPEILTRNGFKIIFGKNADMYFSESSLPALSLPLLKIVGVFSQTTGRTIEYFVIAQKYD